MLSYQHGYHAGGFADLHKHAALCLLIAHLKQKTTPFCMIDCHAGRGLYDLTGEQARRTGEWQAGIAQLVKAEPANDVLRHYLDVVTAFNPRDSLTAYPGSPSIAARLMSEQDRLVLIEAHPAEHEALRRVLRHDPRTHIHKRNSFEALPGLVPPDERRGLVLIDPSYELKTEYQTVPRVLAKVLRRWPSGIFTIWYPLLPDNRHQPLLAGLQTLAKPLLVAELTGPARDQGLRGTGLAVINPPWQFPETFGKAGAELGRCLFGAKGKHVQRVTGQTP
ncbi:MAG: 23S rRNA (adenine(2030)-N(6))-methyltransferase RlmJ [Proteobacteria bacterium]|nr:23S rRNA (adenine(2030)-N(6))-methyltransferase RlmJ [Pseudomonadota bacterium]